MRATVVSIAKSRVWQSAPGFWMLRTQKWLIIAREVLVDSTRCLKVTRAPKC